MQVVISPILANFKAGVGVSNYGIYFEVESQVVDLWMLEI